MPGVSAGRAESRTEARQLRDPRAQAGELLGDLGDDGRRLRELAVVVAHKARLVRLLQPHEAAAEARVLRGREELGAGLGVLVVDARGVTEASAPPLLVCVVRAVEVRGCARCVRPFRVSSCE